ncbi:MAG: hypothetical protein HY272_03675 [Gammaproteobacteria bacterium]|nr:hypothetical protein [Gammaproteobacteria bacterium]
MTTAKAAAENPPMSEGASDRRIHEGRGKRVVSGLHDPLRVQHSEFSNILERLRYATSLIPAKTQLNILRDTGGETGVMQKLIERGIVLEDAINLNPSEMSRDRAGSTWLPQ